MFKSLAMDPSLTYIKHVQQVTKSLKRDNIHNFCLCYK